MKEDSTGKGEKGCLRIQLLGGFSISVEEIIIPETQWKSRRARSLFKLLALAPTHRLHRDQVIDALWPDSDLSAAVNSFHQTLHAARRAFATDGVGALQMGNGFLNLCSGDGQPVVVDAEQFGQAAVRARDSHDPSVYRAALNLYQGDLLPDDLYEEWTVQRREALRQVYLKLLLELAGINETCGEYAQGVDALQRLLAADRSHEEAHAGLMRMYALSGQRLLALRQYQTLKEVLKVELDAEPGQSTTQLFELIRSGHFPAHESPAAPQPESALPLPAHVPKHNLPAQLTSFIGREREIGEISRRLRKHRLVTLTGVGGTGKTRLALKVAESLADTFTDSIFLVELASLSDPELVSQACAQTLKVIERPGVPLETALAGFLSKKHLLLILDNCEHLISTCAHLASSLLESCPQLYILATSREILSTPGESPFRVPSLAVPGPGSIPSLPELGQVEAVRLFVERAALYSSSFELTAGNANAVAQICQRLDGIPLTIELAAARVRMMPVEQIAARLGDAFYLLTGGSRAALPRQQTLKATIDWSYQLLTPKERLFLQRLSVFAGGWTMEEAEAVCSDGQGAQLCPGDWVMSAEVLDLLTQLVDKSLVMVDMPAHLARYRLLETIRQYALDRLVESGCGKAVRDRHMIYCLELGKEIAAQEFTVQRLEVIDQFYVEKENFRAALGWALAGTKRDLAEQGLWLAVALTGMWINTSMLQEGQSWLRRGLEVIPVDSPNWTQLRASALRAVGEIQFKKGHKHEAISTVIESIALYHQTDDRFGLAVATVCLGEITEMFNSLKAQELYEQAETILRTFTHLPDGKWRMAQTLRLIGYKALQAGDTFRSIRCNLESIALFEQSGDRWSAINSLECLAEIYGEEGDLPKMREYVNRSVLILNELKGRPFFEDYFWHLGLLAYANQDFAQMEASYLDFLAYCQKIDNQWMMTWAFRMLAIATKRQDQPVRAAGYCLQGLNQSIEVEDPAGVRAAISLMAGIAVVEQPQRSARLLGSAQALVETFTKSMDRTEAKEFERDTAAARDQLSEIVFQSAWEEGRAMTLDQAIQEATEIGVKITGELEHGRAGQQFSRHEAKPYRLPSEPDR